MFLALRVPRESAPGRPVLVVLSLVCALVGCTAGGEQRIAGAPVVLVVVDTLRADHLGMYGHARPTSPRMDAWVDRGVVFERAFATAPWTLPTFGSIYTGQLPTHHGAGIIVHEDPDDAGEAVGAMMFDGHTKLFAGLRPGAPALAAILGEHGYATGAVVNNPFLGPRFGVARGFQDYDHAAGNDVEMRRADAVVSRALEWIAAQGERPFFLMVHLFDPHMNYDAPPPFRGKFSATSSGAGGRVDLPVRDTETIRRYAARLTASEREFIAAAYDEEVAFVDQEVGRLLAALDRQGVLERALVVLTADHGEELFDHGGFGHGHAMYDEVLRVPLIVWGRGVRPGRIAAPVSVIDIAPTVLDALGIAVPPTMDGGSLWPAIARGASVPSHTLYAECTGLEPERKTVIRWPHKLIVHHDGTSPQLFDLAADPDERSDRAAVAPGIRDRLLEAADHVFAGDGARERLRGTPLDEETETQLRELGYLE
jgi:choline-sulfatase